MLHTENIKDYLPQRLKDQVKELLNLYPITRDSDLRLIAMYYRKNCPEPVSYITADEFFWSGHSYMKDGKVEYQKE